MMIHARHHSWPVRSPHPAAIDQSLCIPSSIPTAYVIRIANTDRGTRTPLQQIVSLSNGKGPTLVAGADDRLAVRLDAVRGRSKSMECDPVQRDERRPVRGGAVPRRCLHCQLSTLPVAPMLFGVLEYEKSDRAPPYDTELL